MEDDEKEENIKKKGVFNSLSQKTNINTIDLPFAMKNKGGVGSIGGMLIKEKEKESVEKRINKFIYLGKMNNFKILKKPQLKKNEPTLFKNINYNEYKQKKSPPPITPLFL